MDKNDAMVWIAKEYDAAGERRFKSAHEGYALILEEMDELWDEIKKHPSRRSDLKMAKEASQLAAMAMRFLVDLPFK